MSATIGAVIMVITFIGSHNSSTTAEFYNIEACVKAKNVLEKHYRADERASRNGNYLGPLINCLETGGTYK